MSQRSRSVPGRSLKTARSVLQVLRILLAHPAGVRAQEVAARLGKSTATASYLLNSLCAEGFAWHDRAGGTYHAAVPEGAADRPFPGLGACVEWRDTAAEERLADAADEVHARTGERAYVATFEGEGIRVAHGRGRQGQPKLPGLTETIRDEAHALAVGKALLAALPPGEVSAHAQQRGLRRFTDRTITRAPQLAAELRAVRARGVAFDIEEYATGFCCIGAAVAGRGGQVAALGVVVPAARFDVQSPGIVEALRDSVQALDAVVGHPTEEVEHVREGR